MHVNGLESIGAARPVLKHKTAPQRLLHRRLYWIEEGLDSPRTAAPPCIRSTGASDQEVEQLLGGRGAHCAQLPELLSEPCCLLVAFALEGALNSHHEAHCAIRLHYVVDLVP